MGVGGPSSSLWTAFLSSSMLSTRGSLGTLRPEGHGSGPSRGTPVGVSGDLNVPNGYVFYVRRGVPRGRRRSAAGGDRTRCTGFFKVSFQWTQTRERLVESHSQSCWQLDSSACKTRTGRGSQKVETELVVGLQCHARHVGCKVETGLQDLHTPFPNTQGTCLDSIGSWTPMLSAARGVDLSMSIATGKVSETSGELAVRP